MTVLRPALLGAALLGLLAFGYAAEHRADRPPADRHAAEVERGGGHEADSGPESVPRAPGPVPSRPAALAVPSASGPVDGPVSSPFGWRQHPVSGRVRHHDGVDLAVPLGTPVRSVASGRVRAVGRRPGYGLVVEIDHAVGLGRRPVRTLYAHLSAADEVLRPGTPVGRGQTIGASGGRPGSDGTSTGPHLHFEVQDASGQPLDPGRFVGTAGTSRPSRWTPTRPLPIATRGGDVGVPERAVAAPRDTVDIWPAADLPPRDELPDLVMPDYPAPPPVTGLNEAADAVVAENRRAGPPAHEPMTSDLDAP